jgi:hypothetical protein
MRAGGLLIEIPYTVSTCTVVTKLLRGQFMQQGHVSNVYAAAAHGVPP